MKILMIFSKIFAFAVCLLCGNVWAMVRSDPPQRGEKYLDAGKNLMRHTVGSAVGALIGLGFLFS